MKALLDVTPDGIVETFHHDPMTDVTAIQRTQDVQPILDHNKRLATWNDGYNMARDMKRIASIPLVVAERWMIEDGINWLALPKREKAAYLRRKLNSSDFAYLRTSPGMM